MLHNPDSGFTVVIVVNRAGEKGGTADPFLGEILQLFPEVVSAPESAPAATPTA
jgi:hypothetical protein